MASQQISADKVHEQEIEYYIAENRNLVREVSVQRVLAASLSDQLQDALRQIAESEKPTLETEDAGPR